MAIWFAPPVRVRIGGEILRVRELRVRDVDALRAWAADRLGDPLDRLESLPDDDLEAAYETEAGEGWPPPAHSAAVQALLLDDEDPAGVAAVLCLTALGQTERGCAAIARAASAPEVAALQRAAWGEDHGDRRARVVREVDRRNGFPGLAYLDPVDNAAPATREQVIAQLACGSGDFPGLAWASPRAIGDLTLTQWRMVLAGAGADDPGDPIPEDDAVRDAVMRARRRFFGMPDLAGAEQVTSSTP